MNEINLKPVQHAVFDAYGTLFDVHSAASRHQSRLGEKAQASIGIVAYQTIGVYLAAQSDETLC